MIFFPLSFHLYYQDVVNRQLDNDMSADRETNMKFNMSIGVKKNDFILGLLLFIIVDYATSRGCYG